jgi:medium-chain acyl-[acyl-carrier-protein] hydrolase
MRAETSTFQYRNNSWLVVTRMKPGVRFRLFCFPYAGGGAAVFRNWQELLPEGVEVCAVQYPGRENRIHESAYTDIFKLVDRLTIVLSGEFNIPFAFFGHSMGAKIAFEIARKLYAEKNILPRSLFLSGCRAPHLPEKRPLHQLERNDFIKELHRFAGGTPETLLKNEELLEIFLPMLRADFTADETYVYRQGEALDCPFYVFGAAHDQEALFHEVDAWSSYPKSTFRLKIFPGDHFFIKTSQRLILRTISKIINNQIKPVKGEI